MEFIKHFFSTEPNPKLELFTLPHILPIVLIIVATVLIGMYKDFFKNWKHEKYFRYGLATSLLICDLSLQVWRLWTDTYSIKYALPLHLCSISVYATIIILLSKKQKAFNYIFYFAMGGALMALLTPDLRFSYTQYRYYEFMIVHGLIMVSIMYMLFVYNFIPRIDSLIKSYVAVHIIGLLMIPFNYITGGTYMMLVNKNEGTILDIFGDWPKYLIGLEILLIILFLISYGLIYLFIIRKENKKLKQLISN